MKLLNSLAVSVMALVVWGMGSADAFASIQVTDLGSNQWKVTMDPLAFTVGSTQSNTNRMVVEDFWTTNQTSSGIDISGNLLFSLNGAAPIAIDFETNNGGFDGISGQVDQNDLLFNYTIDYNSLSIPTIQAGDTVTLSTTNMIFQASPSRIPNAGPFIAHLLNGATSIATTQVGTTVIPEPRSLAIWSLLGYVGVVAGWRRRSEAA